MKFSVPLSIATGAGILILAGVYVSQQGSTVRPGGSMHHQMHAGAMTAPATTTAGTRGANALSMPMAGITKAIRVDIKPNRDTPPGVYRFHKGDQINFYITVPYNGMLAVHGYTNDIPVSANQELTLPLALEHTGRFPMHVHAKSGEHIEIAALEILPD